MLVDGFLAPTWSWRDTPELWSGKHKTTGFNGQAIANLRGDLLFVSEPVTGHNHDMTALAETETADIIAAAYSGIGDKGYQGSGFITPFKKPQGGELLDWQKEFNAQVSKLRAPVERAIAHLKSWRILHTDYRRPLRTYVTSYRAAVGLYFFKRGGGEEGGGMEGRVREREGGGEGKIEGGGGGWAKSKVRKGERNTQTKTKKKIIMNFE